MKILVCTYSGNEKYIDLCVRILDERWTNHPPIIVCSDRGNFVFENKIVCKKRDWVLMMEGCLRELLATNRITIDEQVIVLLEDHVPYASVDGAAIERLAGFLQQHGNTYLNLSGHGADQLVGCENGWHIYNLELHTFSSLHPAIWSVRHFMETLAFARESGALDPWRFERTRIPGSVHFTVDKVAWPSVHGGFLFRGMVNVPAMKFMQIGSLKRLRRLLLWKFVLELPKRLLGRLIAPTPGG